jgi:AraC family transcriptional activator FtrA
VAGMTGIIGFMPTPQGPSPHLVVALALAPVVLLDLAAPTHVFGHCGAPHYDFVLAGARRGPVATSSGYAVVAPVGLEALGRAGTIVVPGGPSPEVPPPPAVVSALRLARERGARVMSVCTGAFVLAHAGILDGLRATTHWQFTAQLAAMFPKVKVDPKVLYVDEGEVLTSAGVAAGIDLCLHVARKDNGAAWATAVARRMVVAPHRDGGQAQYIKTPIDVGPMASVGLERTRAWAIEHLEEDLNVVALARHACMSPRTFARRFGQETGTSPARWVLRQRVLAAQQFLETTDIAVQAVALATGFGSTTTLREHFGRELRTTPTAYRSLFRASS